MAPPHHARGRPRSSRPAPRPPSAISPSVGVSSPATRLRRVDLPHPDGPITATNSPAAHVQVDPRRTHGPARPRLSNVLRSARDGARPRGSAPFDQSPFSCWSNTLRCGLRRREPDAGVAPLHQLRRPRRDSGRSGSAAAVRAVVEHDATRRPREILEPLREVHGVADEGVLDAAPRSRAAPPPPRPVDSTDAQPERVSLAPR